jgi:hypothetical protein
VQEEESLTMEAPRIRQMDDRLMRLSGAGNGGRIDAQQPATVTTMDAMNQASGAGAVQMSKSIRAMKSAEVAPEAEIASSGLVSIKGRTLRRQAGGAWVDVDYKTDAATIKFVFASEAYFTFLRVFPEAREFCKLGKKVIFKFHGKFVQIGDDGEKQISEVKLQERF